MGACMGALTAAAIVGAHHVYLIQTGLPRAPSPLVPAPDVQVVRQVVVDWLEQNRDNIRAPASEVEKVKVTLRAPASRRESSLAKTRKESVVEDTGGRSVAENERRVRVVVREEFEKELQRLSDRASMQIQQQKKRLQEYAKMMSELEGEHARFAQRQYKWDNEDFERDKMVWESLSRLQQN